MVRTSSTAARVPQLMLFLATFASTIILGCSASIATNGEDLQPIRGLPPADPARRPHFDIVVAAFVRGGNSTDAQHEIARVRQMYARYDGRVVPESDDMADHRSNSSLSSVGVPLTLKLIFVVGTAGLPEDVEVPKAGLMLGEFYHVNIREGYRYLADKTKALMMGISDHLRCAQSRIRGKRSHIIGQSFSSHLRKNCETCSFCVRSHVRLS